MQRPKGGIDDLFSGSFGSTPAKRSRNGNTLLTSSSSPARSGPFEATTPFKPFAGTGSSPALQTPSATTGTTAEPFHLRASKHAKQETLNDHLRLPTRADIQGNNSRCKLNSTADPKAYNYRYMYEQIMERSESLDQTIDDAAQAMKDYYGIEEYGDPSMQSQEDIIAFGRICQESDNAKLSEGATWLETSRVMGSGQRVQLQFDHDMKVRGAPPGSGGIGLFPGCLVGLRGKNGGGKIFAVSEVLIVRYPFTWLVSQVPDTRKKMPPIDVVFTAPSKLLADQYGTANKQAGGHPLSVFVAAGPYTLDLDLDYAPLDDLVRAIEQERPDVVVLLGPFVDQDHSLIKSGDVDATPVQIFQRQISSRLNALVKSSPRTSVILVPHARDMVSTHCAFPQSPLDKSELGTAKQVKYLPNPATFTVNEVSFGVCTVDVVFHLRNQEFFRRAQDVIETDENDNNNDGGPSEADLAAAKDVIARTCRHMLRQRSYYPIFPAPLAGKGPIKEQLNLDVTHEDLIKMGSSTTGNGGGADIVIVPSMLKHFVKVVDSTVMVNPAYLTKTANNSAGTYARLTIHPLPKHELERRVEGNQDEGLEPDEPIEHRVWDRCRVDIIRL